MRQAGAEEMGRNTGGRSLRPRTTLKVRLKILLSIDPDPFVPDALSHQQLNALLQAAMDTSAVPEGQLSDDELLRAALSAWADQTQELLRWIEGQGDAVSDTRTPKQVMALGSFRTHLVMGLKALRYSEG